MPVLLSNQRRSPFGYHEEKRDVQTSKGQERTSQHLYRLLHWTEQDRTMGYHQSERAKDGSFKHVPSLGLPLSVFGEEFRRWGHGHFVFWV